MSMGASGSFKSMDMRLFHALIFARLIRRGSNWSLFSYFFEILNNLSIELPVGSLWADLTRFSKTFLLGFPALNSRYTSLMSFNSWVVIHLCSPLVLNSGIWSISHTFLFWFHHSSIPDFMQCRLSIFLLDNPWPFGLIVSRAGVLVGEGVCSSSASDAFSTEQIGHLLLHGRKCLYWCWVESSTIRSKRT